MDYSMLHVGFFEPLLSTRLWRT